MKKIIILSAFLYLALTSFANATDINIGEKAPCETEYSAQCPWTGPKLDLLELNNCYYLVEYYYRLCTYYDLQIVGIYQILGQNCPITNQVKKQAYVQLWIDNPMEFPNTTNMHTVWESICAEYYVVGPNENINLKVPASLSDIALELPESTYVKNEDGSLTVPLLSTWFGCAGSVCCDMHYFITRNDQHKIISILHWYPENQEQPDCEGVNCASNCYSLEFDWYAPPGIISDVKDDVEETTSIISPNPNKGIFTLDYSSNFTGEVEFEIYSFSGKLIHTNSYDKAGDNIKVQLDFSGIPVGYYTYYIKNKGVINSRGTFIIVY